MGGGGYFRYLEHPGKLCNVDHAVGGGLAGVGPVVGHGGGWHGALGRGLREHLCQPGVKVAALHEGYELVRHVSGHHLWANLTFLELA